MRLIDANALLEVLEQRKRLCKGVYGNLGGAISGVIKLIDNAPTVFAYTDDDMCKATTDGYDVAKSQYEFNTENFKKYVESRVDMQDLYLPIHFFDLLDEYCGKD